MPNKQLPRIAITGAQGFLGSALVDYFADQGWRVRALARQPARNSKKNVEFVKYDLLEPVPPSLLKDVDYLVHTAYIKQNRSNPNAFEENVRAAENLVAAARKQGVRKCVFMSSMSAHEDAESSYGQQKLAIEKIFSGSDCVSIRAGLIIGNGGIVKQMADFMRSKHTVPLIGGGQQPLQIISVANLLSTIERVLDDRFSGSYTVATSEVYTYKQFYEALSHQLRVRVLFIPIPFWILLTVIRIITALHVPLAVNADNALGLKKLRSMETAGDLKKLGIKLDNLEQALAKSGY